MLYILIKKYAPIKKVRDIIKIISPIKKGALVQPKSFKTIKNIISARCTSFFYII